MNEKLCTGCGRKKVIPVGETCEDCLDNRWPDELDVASVEFFDGFWYFDDDAFPEDEEIFLL